MAKELLHSDRRIGDQRTGSGIEVALKSEWPHSSTGFCDWDALLSKVDRQQLCCMRVEPQFPPICLQQACSAAFICADGIATPWSA